MTSFLYDALSNVSQETLYSLRYNGANHDQSTVQNWASGQSATADNRVTRLAYDAAGRLVFTVDGENYVTENRYDADGRKTLSIRYTIDARKRAEFEEYARSLAPIIPRCGGQLIGYWLPTRFAGPTNAALALIDFPSLAAYERYREALAADAEHTEVARRAAQSGCILVEDRSFIERVS